MKEGGEDVAVRLHPGSRAQGTEVTAAVVEDNNNGIYTATYTAPAKGNYMVCTSLIVFSSLFTFAL
jgi:arginine/serine-rich splicing factor 12